MPKFLDLFAGAGGLSEGFIRAGYDAVAHVEMDTAACYTLKTRMAYHWLHKEKNIDLYNNYLAGTINRKEFYEKIPNKILDSVLNYEISEENINEIFNKIDEILGNETLDIIIGGPPCQAYSIAGRARDDKHMVGDKRNYLYKFYVKFVERYMPKYFVFENVVGLKSAKDADKTFHLDNLIAAFQDIGYAIEYKILNASDYGVLQNRKRIILIGSRDEKENFYPEINKVESDFQVKEIFCDLPSLKAGEGISGPVATLEYDGRYLYDSGIKAYDGEPVTMHQARPNKEKDLEIYRIVTDAWNKNHKRIMYNELPVDLISHKNKKNFLDRFKVVAGDLSHSQTVVAHIARDGHYYIHPDIEQNRSITPREAARLQTFPDNYYFESNTGKFSRTLAYKQIGNAVPVCLSYYVAEALLSKFDDDD